ncbi:MAG: hypothetical protein AABX30_02260 [Nanoarchaeota archaeon]
MGNTIDMQDMRYINLFGKITQVNTRFCFKYNDMIIFAVPEKLISKAIGLGGKNIKKISGTLNRKIKVIKSLNGEEDARRFIADIVSPVTFRDLEIRENEIIIAAGSQNKAALIGRNRRRFIELQKIVKNYFSKDLKII